MTKEYVIKTLRDLLDDWESNERKYTIFNSLYIVGYQDALEFVLSVFLDKELK